MNTPYLESWIAQIAASVLGVEAVGRQELERYQLLRLRQTLEYSYERSSFYRRLYDEAGVDPRQINSLSDLSRLPFTEAHHLSEMPYRFLCVSQADVARPYSFVTSGTTGPQKKIFWSQGDLERIIEFMAAGISTVAGPGDVVQIMLADGRPYSQSDLLARGVALMGGVPVPADLNAGSDALLQIVKDSRSTILFGYTSRIFRLSRELEGKHDLAGLGIKALFLAGEYVPADMRQELQKLWNCKVYTHYGLTEMGLGVAVECDAGDGYHFNEAGLLLEIVDPNSGRIAAPGEEGEMVFTTLTREAMPLIRYRTHDLSRMIPGKCPCGSRLLARFAAVKKRLESTVILEGGDVLYPSLFDDVLYGIPGLVDYQVTLRKQGGRTQIIITVEVLGSGTEDEVCRKALTIPAVGNGVAAGRIGTPVVKLVEAGAPGQFNRAKKVILEVRNK